MAARNEMDRSGKSFSQGQAAEDSFRLYAQNHGWAVAEASPSQDRYEHFDFVISKNGQRARIEVKSARQFPIAVNGRMTTRFVLVEFRGITGHDGWLYGNADFIAFERPEGFLLVGRNKLIQLADELVSDDRASRKENMFHKLYSREGRDDLVSALSIEEVEKIGAWWK